MKVGVDARMLIGQKSGIGHYVATLLGLFGEKSNNIFYLYSPEPFSFDCNNDQFKKRINPARNNLHWMQVVLPRVFAKDEVDMFWGGNYAIPVWPKYLKKIITLHDFVFKKYPRTLPLRRLIHMKATLRLYVRQADRILVVSNHTARDLQEFYSIPERKITVTHLAARQEFIQELPEPSVDAILSKYNLNRGYLLYVGTVEPRKGVDTIIRALDIHRKRRLTTPQMVVVGQIGWKASPIFKLVEQLSLSDEVRFLNYVPDTDLPALYQGASVFIYPSLYEGFGLPVLEALASGLPTITTRVASLPEVAGRAALYINPGDADSLSAYIDRLLNDPVLCDRLSGASRKQASLFSWHITAQNTLKAFKEVLGK